jgi:hypothetical protein
MKNPLKSLSPITRSFIIGMTAAPIIWLCMVAFLLLLGG